MSLTFACTIDIGKGTAFIVEHLLWTEETGYLYGSIFHRIGGMDNILLIAHRVVATNGTWGSLTSVGHTCHCTDDLYSLHTRDSHSHHWRSLH